jgi:hypothetical protein
MPPENASWQYTWIGKEGLNEVQANAVYNIKTFSVKSIL